HASARLTLSASGGLLDPVRSNCLASTSLTRRWRTLLSAEFLEQRLGVFQVGGVEALGEPVVDSREHRAGFLAMTLLVEQPRETCRRAQFPRFRVLLARNLDRGAEGLLGLPGIRRVLGQQQFTLQPMHLGFVE